jgi:hypothetical protein
MATPTYVSAGSSTRGVTSAEAGINISSFKEQFDNPMEYLLDRFNGRTGFATDYDASSTISVSGEVSTTLPLVAGLAFATAITAANQTDGYGITTGDNFLTDLGLSQDRGSWQTADYNLTRVEGLTAA